MSTTKYMFLYLLGASSTFYLGWRVALWQMRKTHEYNINKAYARGWKAGREYFDRINNRKLDLESSVRILNGESLEVINDSM